MFAPTRRCNYYSSAYDGHVDEPLAELQDTRWSTGITDCGGHMIHCLRATSVFACTLSDFSSAALVGVGWLSPGLSIDFF